MSCEVIATFKMGRLFYNESNVADILIACISHSLALPLKLNGSAFVQCASYIFDNRLFGAGLGLSSIVVPQPGTKHLRNVPRLNSRNV